MSSIRYDQVNKWLDKWIRFVVERVCSWSKLVFDSSEKLVMMLILSTGVRRKVCGAQVMINWFQYKIITNERKLLYFTRAEHKYQAKLRQMVHFYLPLKLLLCLSDLGNTYSLSTIREAIISHLSVQYLRRECQCRSSMCAAVLWFWPDPAMWSWILIINARTHPWDTAGENTSKHPWARWKQ